MKNYLRSLQESAEMLQSRSHKASEEVKNYFELLVNQGRRAGFII